MMCNFTKFFQFQFGAEISAGSKVFRVSATSSVHDSFAKIFALTREHYYENCAFRLDGWEIGERDNLTVAVEVGSGLMDEKVFLNKIF